MFLSWCFLVTVAVQDQWLPCAMAASLCLVWCASCRNKTAGSSLLENLFSLFKTQQGKLVHVDPWCHGFGSMDSNEDVQ